MSPARDLLLIYAHRQKFRIFLRVGGGVIEKGRFSGFLGWVFCRSATAYIEHQISTQKAWIISGDAVDVPLGVSDSLTNNGTSSYAQKIRNF